MTKTYGNKDNKIYVIGSCIVSGTTVMRDAETFGACFYRRLEEEGMPYSVICF